MTNILKSVRYSLPREWKDKSRADMELVKLKKSSPKFKEIKSKMGRYKPKQIYRVENPYLWALYQLKMEECMQRRSSTIELELWHVTCPSYIDSIALNNFDWRRSRRRRAKFGQGVCFSNNLFHGLLYSTYKGAIILAKVLMGKRTGIADNNTEIPPSSRDTTTGWGGDVYVKYMDNEFYPAYVIYL